MNPLLEQFLSEAREFLQGIGEKLMQLEDEPDNADLMTELFRFVHTLKGNSGLFEFPEMTRVLHAGEDLMDAVRHGRVSYSQALADQLLDAMDFVGILCDEIEADGHIDASRAADSARLAKDLRALILVDSTGEAATTDANKPAAHSQAQNAAVNLSQLPLTEIPETARVEAYRRAKDGDVHWINYRPIEECFFQGDDPFFTARQTPDILWGKIVAREPWPPIAELDAYRCVLEFRILTAAPRNELDAHFQYMPDQVEISTISPLYFVIPQGNPNGGPVYGDFIDDVLPHLDTGNLVSLKKAAQTMLELSNPDLWLSSALRWLMLLMESEPDNKAAFRLLIESLRTLTPPDWSGVNTTPEETVIAQTVTAAAVESQPESTLLSDEDAAALKVILAAQLQILNFDDKPSWQAGRLKAVAAVLSNCYKVSGDPAAQEEIADALVQSLEAESSTPLLTWLEVREGAQTAPKAAALVAVVAPVKTEQTAKPAAEVVSENTVATTATEEGPRFGRRAEDTGSSGAASSKSLKVDQTKIDRLMNLIGEMVVSKNALPYLAQRAEDQFGVRELSREIKSQYSVINRIAEEMQDAIMQVRMMPVSFVFQRFPRLVRDISRKLGKEVQLVLEGEETEADKNIIESLADPLIHIVRNSLDHGLETPDVRLAKGKPATGTLTIRAAQEGDQVLIEIIDDGKGIDPNIIKRKAYEKGVIDEATMERITDREAVNLVFAAGFSTAEVVSDLSGRGVGMDVVRTAVDKVNGTIQLESETGKGTRIRISLPLSMAITKVMIVESDRQTFGVPMDHVVETVRVPCSAIRTIKRNKTTVLRGNIVPLKALNKCLGLHAEPKANADNEIAVLVVKINGNAVGLIVDEFQETVDVIQKPLGGVLSGLSAYSGSALMGDGSVLMVLNVKEVV